MSKLYIVPTPIGNLEHDFSAIQILKEVDLILAEDTRTSGKLLKHFEMAHMYSHHMHNEHKTVENLISRLKAGKTL
jgi:16S rRNA (cytidine1402-2'-O)-methyltransferase